MSAFTESVDHYCKGLAVAVGCRGIECEHSGGDENHQCEPGFSSHQCDSCGSTFGGDRSTAYGLDRKNPREHDPIELSICVDCVLYHANGDEPTERWYQHPVSTQTEWEERHKAEQEANK